MKQACPVDIRQAVGERQHQLVNLRLRECAFALQQV